MKRFLLVVGAVLLVFAFPNASRAELATVVEVVAPTPTTIEGHVEYGCGGTTGTMCFLVTPEKGVFFMISMLFDTTDRATELLNAAAESKKCVAVTGKLSTRKLGVFFVFDDRYSIRLEDCGREAAG